MSSIGGRCKIPGVGGGGEVGVESATQQLELTPKGYLTSNSDSNMLGIFQLEQVSTDQTAGPRWSTDDLMCFPNIGSTVGARHDAFVLPDSKTLLSVLATA
ncbi:hypothetical protein E5288_WYG014711 [Bos mutus]|uniref:Uncharacterized protein n=1 Tax=Bos mutus TaxID=72004 RepID=A0A6B0R1U2_9CETA|nr:hypothetical protein [Bos mutus]